MASAQSHPQQQPRPESRPGAFARFARAASRILGDPIAFMGAVVVVLLWAVAGPLFSFSATWQLVINTTTTIITFLMVFLIQATQNRDNQALQLKLDELIHATKDAREELIDLEEQSDSVLHAEHDHMKRQRNHPH